MDVISFCIIPGKKAAVFKDILSTLHIPVQYYKEHAPKENYCLIRVFSSTVTFKRFMHIIDWLISLSAFDNVETQGESNLITIRFSFSNQVKKNVISEYWKEIGQPPLSENFSLKCQIRIGLYGVKNLTFYEECMGSSTLLPATNFAFYDGWYFLKYYMRTVKKWKSY